MNPIVPRSLWIAPLAALTLLGAGCFTAEPAPTTPVVPMPTSKTAPADPTPTAPTASTAPTNEPTAVSPTKTSNGFKLPEIDATWQTYTNRQETYSFQYPMRGKYAPTWTAKIVAANDKSYKDGCYYGGFDPNPGRFGEGPKKITVDGVEFCHTMSADGVAARGLSDIYTGTVGNQIIAIIFEKIAHSPHQCVGVNLNCDQAVTEQAEVLPVGNSYTLFYEKEYLMHLDQIMGTFKKLK